MSRWMLVLAVLAGVLGARPALAQHRAKEAEIMAQGRQLTEWLYTGVGDSVFVRMDEANQRDVENPANLAGIAKLIEDQGGEEFALASERVMVEQGGKVHRYQRKVHFTKVPEITILVEWVFGANGKIISWNINSD
jgi:hypothetical protein